jgi:hypothetical protein
MCIAVDLVPCANRSVGRGLGPAASTDCWNWVPAVCACQSTPGLITGLGSLPGGTIQGIE